MQRGENVPKGPRMIKHQLKADVKAGASGEGTIHGSEDQEFGDSLRDCRGHLLKSNKGRTDNVFNELPLERGYQ